WLVLLKLLVQPALVAWLALGPLALGPLQAKSAILGAALPTGSLVFVLAYRYRLYVERSTSVILISTVLSGVTLAILLVLLGTGWARGAHPEARMPAARPRLGYVGVGLMGGPMARRLLAAGYPLTVWNRDPAKAAPLAAAGATAAGSAAEVARDSDIVFTCLTDTAAVEAVVFGPGGIVAGGRAGAV